MRAKNCPVGRNGLERKSDKKKPEVPTGSWAPPLPDEAAHVGGVRPEVLHVGAPLVHDRLLGLPELVVDVRQGDLEVVVNNEGLIVNNESLIVNNESLSINNESFDCQQ